MPKATEDTLTVQKFEAKISGKINTPGGTKVMDSDKSMEPRAKTCENKQILKQVDDTNECTCKRETDSQT